MLLHEAGRSDGAGDGTDAPPWATTGLSSMCVAWEHLGQPLADCSPRSSRSSNQSGSDEAADRPDRFTG